MSECNKVITIGYLKQFVEGSGVVVNDGGFPNSYCLSFKQLTGNSFVQKGSISSSNPKDDIDGIIVNSNYNDNQLVNQRDISLVYTSFGELRISSDKTTIPTSGGNATLSITYTYTRRTKTMKSDCSSYETITTNANGNCNDLSYTTIYGNVSNCTNYSIGENSSPEGHTNSRTDSIYATINFRGSTHTSNTITIIQDALTGSFIGDATTGEVITSLIANATTSTVFNTCTGDTYGAVCTEKYYVTRNWVDNTGRQYPSITGKSDVSGESDLEKTYSSVTRTFSAVGCPTVSCNAEDTIQFSYGSMVSDSIKFTRTASNQCGSCEDSVEYGSTSATVNNVDMCGGLITVQASVPGTIHNKGWVGGVCTETGTTPTSSTQSITVNVGANTTSSTKQYTGSDTTSQGGTINYTINQLAGPCGGCTGANTTYSFESKTVSCSGENDVQVVYTATTTYGNCPPKQDTGYTTPEDIPCNDSSTPTSHTFTFEGTSYTINQNAGPCCPIECDCNDFTLGSDPTEWAYNNTDNKDVSVTSGLCISDITITNPDHFTATLGSDKIIISPNGENTTTSPYEETITINYKANGSSCPSSKTISVKQNPNTCPTAQCTCYIVGTATAETIASSTTNVTVTFPYTAITVTTAATCIVSSSETTSSSTYKVTGIPTNDTCGDIMRTGSFTWSDHKACGTYSCSSDDVTVNWKVNQKRGKEATDPECTGCYCSGFTLGSAPSDWNCDEMDERSVSYTADTCLTDITATTSDSHFTVSVDSTNKQVKVKPNSKNTTDSNITATVTVNYKANGSDCESKTFTVKHSSGSTCYCLDDCNSITSFTKTKTENLTKDSQTNVNIGNYGIHSACDSSNFSVGCDENWISVTTRTSNTILVSCNANDAYSARTATIYGKWNGTSCEDNAYFRITQNGKPCDSTASSVDTSDIVFASCESGSDDAKKCQITLQPGVTIGGIVNNSGYFHTEISNDNKFVVYPNNSNSGRKHEETIGIKFNIDGSECALAYKGIKVIHNAAYTITAKDENDNPITSLDCNGGIVTFEANPKTT